MESVVNLRLQDTHAAMLHIACTGPHTVEHNEEHGRQTDIFRRCASVRYSQRRLRMWVLSFSGRKHGAKTLTKTCVEACQKEVVMILV